MSDWFLWDGEHQHGPMDRSELDNRVRIHPNPGVVRVWRSDFSEWKTVEEALDLTPQSAPETPPPLDPPSASLKKPIYRDFVGRHWRGELPLWISYFAVNSLTTLLAIVVVNAIALATTARASVGPTGILLFYVLSWLFVISITVWQVVGSWRCAGRRIAERKAIGKRAPWARLAKIMVCLGCLQLAGLLIKSAIPQLSEAVSIAFLNDPDLPPYAIRVMNGGSEAEITGGIKFGLTADFERTLKASGGVRVVHLDSNGGRINEAQKLNALIRSRGLDTYVDAKCLSACTLAFAGGQQRILKKGAQLGFHRGAFAGEDQIDDHDLESSIYRAAGIDSAFIDRAMATKNSDLWRPSEAQLLSAGVVTRISSGGEFAISGYGGNNITREVWDKSLQKASPVYRVLKERYPKAYDEILDIFADGAVKGTPQGELVNQAGDRLRAFVRNLLPYTDDSVVTEFGQLAIDQYRSLQLQDETTCYKFAAGIDDEAPTATIPAELTDRELALDARVISSARMRPSTEVATDSSWDKIRASLVSRGYSGSDLRLLHAESVAPSDYGRYCDLSISLFQEITKLPSKEAASVLRKMFSES
jgi:hypothetical protein